MEQHIANNEQYGHESYEEEVTMEMEEVGEDSEDSDQEGCIHGIGNDFQQCPELKFRDLYLSEQDHWPVLWRSLDNQNTEEHWIPVYKSSGSNGVQLFAWDGVGSTPINVTLDFDSSNESTIPRADIQQRRHVFEKLKEQEVTERARQNIINEFSQGIFHSGPDQPTEHGQADASVAEVVPLIQQLQNYIECMEFPPDENDETVNEELYFSEFMSICKESRHYGGLEYCNEMLRDSLHPSVAMFYGTVQHGVTNVCYPALFFGPRPNNTSSDNNGYGTLVCILCSPVQDNDGHHEPMIVKAKVSDFFGVISKPLCDYESEILRKIKRTGQANQSIQLQAQGKTESITPILMPVTWTLASQLFKCICKEKYSLAQCSALIFEHVEKRWSTPAVSQVQLILSSHFTKDDSSGRIVGVLHCSRDGDNFPIESKKEASLLLDSDLSKVLNAHCNVFRFKSASCLAYRTSETDEARELYDQWLISARQNLDASHILLAETAYGSTLRGCLVGKAEATIEEFLLTKVILDSRSDAIQHLLKPIIQKYTINQKSAGGVTEKERYMHLYRKIVENNLMHKDFDLHREKFYNSKESSTVADAVVSALMGFNRSKPPKVLPNRVTQRFLQNVFRHCIILMRKSGVAKITSKIAAEAHQLSVSPAQPEMMELTNPGLCPQFLETWTKMLEAKYLDIDESDDSDAEYVPPSKKSKAGAPAKDKAKKLKYTITHSTKDPGHPVAHVHYFKRDTEQYSLDELAFIMLEFPFSPKFVNDLLEDWDRVQWLRAQGGQQGTSYIRSLSTDDVDKPAFVVADRILYPCAPVNSPMEKKLIASLQRVCDKLLEALRLVHPDVFIPNIYFLNQLNALLSNAGHGLYGKHSDWNIMVSLKDNELCVEVEDCRFLPDRPNMAVFTFVINTDPTPNATSLGVEFDRSCVAESANEDHTKMVDELPIPNLCLHIQPPGANGMGHQHWVKVSKGVQISPGSVRAALTVRSTFSPSFNKEQYMARLKECLKCEVINHPSPTDYERHNGGVTSVITRLRSCVINNDPIDEDHPGKKNARENKKPPSEKVKAAGGPFYLMREPHKDTYRQLKLEDYLKLVGEPIDSFARLNGKLIHHLFGPYGVRALLRLDEENNEDMRVYPMLKCKNGMKCEILFSIDEHGKKELCKIGKKYRLSMITTYAGLKHTSRARPIFKYREGHPLIVIISKAYKNEYVKINSHMQLVRRFRHTMDQRKSLDRNDKMDDIPPINHRDQRVFYICGHGGMQINNGAHVANPKLWSKRDPLVNIPWGQNVNSEKNLSEREHLAETGMLFAVFVNDKCFKETLKGDDSPKCLPEEEVEFAGYGYSCSHGKYKMSEEEFKTFVGNNGPQFEKHAGFMLGWHIRTGIRMAFDANDYVKLEQMPKVSTSTQVRATNSQMGWETVLVHPECPFYMEMDCSIKQQSKMLITEKQICEDFVARGKFRLLENPSAELGKENGFHIRPACPETAEGVTIHRVDGVQESKLGKPITTLAREQESDEEESTDEATQESKKADDGEDSSPNDSAADSSAATDTPGKEKPSSSDISNPVGTGIEEEEVMIPTADDADDEISNTRITIEDIIRVGMFTQLAGSLRFAGKSIYTDDTKDDIANAARMRLHSSSQEDVDAFIKKLESTYQKGEQTALPLVEPHSHYLNQGMIRNASPMSNRTFDCNVHFLLEEMELRGYQREEGMTINLPENILQRTELLYETLHSVCLFRILGRTAPFHHYRETTGTSHSIPLPNEVESFLLFMERTVEGNESKSSLSQWISDQHKGQVPHEWHQFSGFSRLATNLDRELRPAFRAYYNNNFQKGKATWKDAVQMLNKVLQGMVADPKSKTLWLSQMIIGDMDELFDTPFGLCSSEFLVSAQGSRTCLRFLQNNGQYNKKNHNNLADALEAIQEYVNDPTKVPNDCLRVMGYKRVEVDGNPGTFQVINVINGTLFDAKHAEHLMCKLYVQTKYTSASYRKSLKPVASKVYCWPLKHHDKNLTENKRLEKHMNDCVLWFHNLIATSTDATVQRLLSLPSVVILAQDEVKFPPSAATA